MAAQARGAAIILNWTETADDHIDCVRRRRGDYYIAASWIMHEPAHSSLRGSSDIHAGSDRVYTTEGQTDNRVFIEREGHIANCRCPSGRSCDRAGHEPVTTTIIEQLNNWPSGYWIPYLNFYVNLFIIFSHFFYYDFKCWILKMLMVSCDIIQKYFKIVDLHIVITE